MGDKNLRPKKLLVEAYNLNNFQSRDMIITAPLRSYLYCLEPIGIGTTFVESLTSYLSRLAQAHLLYLRKLVVERIFPLFERKYLPSGPDNNLHAFWKDSATLNSNNLSTRDWVHVLEKLTLRSDLRYLTMLTWSDVLSPRYLLRRTKAWCSACYKEWSESDVQVYEPLIWMLDVVSICTRHNCYLDIQCTNQQCKRHLSMLMPQMQLGYCDYCGSYLDNISEWTSGQIPTEEELEWQKWVVKAVGELLASASKLSTLPRSEKFANAVAEQLSNTFDGNISAMARRLQVSQRTIRDWVKGIQIPQLESLLRFCYFSQISPLCLFEGDVAYAEAGTTVSLKLQQKVKKHYRVFPSEKIRLELEAELLSQKEVSPSMNAVAKRLKYDHSFLCKHFPDLCHAISDRHRVYRKKQRAERKQRILNEVRETTYRVHNQGLYPSQERVRLLLAKPGSIKESGALAVWHATLRDLGLENKEF